MGWCPCAVQFWAGISEGTWWHCGRCTKPSLHSAGPGHSKINLWWSSNGIGTLGQSPWPCHTWGWLLLRARGTCHHRPCASTNACYWLDWSQEGGPNIDHSLRLADSTEEDRFLRCFWQRTPPVKKADWSCKIGRTSQFIREPYT